MKLSIPIAMALFLVGCVTTPPRDPQVAHQRELWEQAHANFLAMGGKDRSKPAASPVPHNVVQAKPAPTRALPPQPPARTTLAQRTVAPAQRPMPITQPHPRTRMAVQQRAIATPAPVRVRVQPRTIAGQPHPPVRPAPRQPLVAAQTRHTTPPSPVAKSQPARGADTVYYWQVPAGRQRTPKQLAAETKYARRLGKRPERLTAEERIWADEHY